MQDFHVSTKSAPEEREYMTRVPSTWYVGKKNPGVSLFVVVSWRTTLPIFVFFQGSKIEAQEKCQAAKLRLCRRNQPVSPQKCGRRLFQVFTCYRGKSIGTGLSRFERENTPRPKKIGRLLHLPGIYFGHSYRMMGPKNM